MNETLKSQLLEVIVRDRFTNPQNALENSWKLYEESIKTNDYYYASISKFYEGDAYLSLDDLAKSCEHLLEAVSIQQTHGYSDYLGKCYNVLGVVFFSQCDYVLAMKYFLYALEIAIDNKDHYTQALIYNNMAAIFLLYNDFRHSRQFFMKAIHGKLNKQKTSLDDSCIFLRMRMNTGICYAAEGKIREAQAYFDEIMANITDEELEMVHMYIAEMGLTIYKKSGEMDKALDFALHMVESAKKYCNSANIIVTFECIHFLTDQNHFDEAKELLHIVESVSQKNITNQNKSSILQEWIYLFKKMKDQKSCNEYYKKYYQLMQENKENYIQSQVIAIENRNRLTKVMDTNKELQLQKNEYEKRTSIDSLTCLLNRNGMKQYIKALLEECKKKQRIINIAIIDIDHFKHINDTYGHLVGDQCIREVAKSLQSMENDRIHGVRFGGDEFLLIGKGITEKTWENIIVKLQNEIREKEIQTGKKESVSITSSIGVFSHIPSKTMEFHDYIHYADFALYQVKKQGRNSYLVYDSHSDPKEVFHEL